jgi:hypothetical protein
MGAQGRRAGRRAGLGVGGQPAFAVQCVLCAVGGLRRCRMSVWLPHIWDYLECVNAVLTSGTPTSA